MAGDHTLDCFPPGNPIAIVEDLWSKLSVVFGQPSATTILVHSPDAKDTKDKKVTDGAVVLTRSAIGSLRLAEADPVQQDVGFFSEEEAEEIIERNTKSRCFNSEFYYRNDNVTGETIEQEWASRFRRGFDNKLSAEERTLGHNRVLIIIEMTADQPADAYVSVRRGGLWYSIKDSDTISKMNFALLGNILIVQAKAPQQAPTQTVITAAH